MSRETPESYHQILLTAGEDLAIGDIVKIAADGRAVKRKIDLEVKQYMPIIVVSSVAPDGDHVAVVVVAPKEDGHGS